MEKRAKVELNWHDMKLFHQLSESRATALNVHMYALVHLPGRVALFMFRLSTCVAQRFNDTCYDGWRGQKAESQSEIRPDWRAFDSPATLEIT